MIWETIEELDGKIYRAERLIGTYEKRGMKKDVERLRMKLEKFYDLQLLLLKAFNDGLIS